MLYLYNTLTKKKEQFRPLKNKKVNIFVCGPTVYDKSHLGHARTYIAFDFIVKYLRWQGYKVSYLQNITDVDDKIIQRARKENKNWKDLAKEYEKKYKEDMNRIFVNSVNQYARATDYIPEIISQVERLIKKGTAYEIKNDGIYFDISKFKDYGKLSGRTIEQAEDATSRIDQSINKRNKGDFCLWKHAKSAPPSRRRVETTANTNAPMRMFDKEPAWLSPWGWGRPGWHIEDTAITEKEFGAQYDIHGGAIDLIFPHHEAEIAQMESISNKKPMVKYWLHTGLLTVDGKKMSKSLGNFKPIEYKDPMYLRFLIFSNHYQKSINYNQKNLGQASKNFAKIMYFIYQLNQTIKTKKSSLINKKIKKIVDNTKTNFYKSLDDNFNTPKALAEIFILIHGVNKTQINASSAKYCLKFIKEINNIFQILPIFYKIPKISIPKKIRDLTDQRAKYRQEKNWNEADKIRKQLEKMGYELKDLPDGNTTIKIK